MFDCPLDRQASKSLLDRHSALAVGCSDMGFSKSAEIGVLYTVQAVSRERQPGEAEGGFKMEYVTELQRR